MWHEYSLSELVTIEASEPDWEETQFCSILEALKAQHPNIIRNIDLNIDDKLEDFENIVRGIIDACDANEALCTTLLNFSTLITTTTEQPLEGGITLLHLAASLGDLESVKLLTERGAEISKEGYQFSKKCTALDLAASTGNIELVRFLITQGAKGDFINMFCSAVYYRHAEIVEFLLKKKLVTNLNVLMYFLEDHSFPINLAIQSALIHLDVYNNEQDYIKGNFIKVLSLLLSHGASCNPPYTSNISKYTTPLHIIAEHYNDSSYHKFLLRLLIASGADRSIVNYQEQTAERINPSMTPIIDEAEKTFAQSAKIWNFYKLERDSNKEQIDYDLLREWYLLKLNKGVCITMSRILYLRKKPFNKFPPEIADQILGYLFEPPLAKHRFSTIEEREKFSQKEDSITSKPGP